MRLRAVRGDVRARLRAERTAADQVPAVQGARREGVDRVPMSDAAAGCLAGPLGRGDRWLAAATQGGPVGMQYREVGGTLGGAPVQQVHAGEGSTMVTVRYGGG